MTRAVDLVGIFQPIFDAQRAAAKLRTVYPLYLVSRIRRALRGVDPEGIIASVGEFETLGNSRYAIPVTDASGTTYRITVEVVS